MKSLCNIGPRCKSISECWQWLIRESSDLTYSVWSGSGHFSNTSSICSCCWRISSEEWPLIISVLDDEFEFRRSLELRIVVCRGWLGVRPWLIWMLMLRLGSSVSFLVVAMYGNDLIQLNRVNTFVYPEEGNWEDDQKGLLVRRNSWRDGWDRMSAGRLLSFWRCWSELRLLLLSRLKNNLARAAAHSMRQ